MTPEVLIRYWANACEDTDWIGVGRERREKQLVTTTLDAVRVGQVRPEDYEAVLATIEPKMRPREQNPMPPLPVWICPRKYLSALHHQAERPDIPSELYPFWIPAFLGATGGLSPNQARWPRFEREILDPLWPGIPVIGSVATLDAVARENPLPHNPRWQHVWRQAESIFRGITNTPSETWCPPGYVVTQAATAYLLFDPEPEGMTETIRRAYRATRRDRELPVLQALLPTTAATDLPLLTDDDARAVAAERHLAHVSPKHPLSPSQREALLHFLAEDCGPVFALNGPPGTGKTTILKTIVASLWANSAEAGNDPPVVAAASATGKGSANIVKGFCFPPDGDSMHRRWIPRFDGFGIFVASGDNKADDDCLNFDQLETLSRCADALVGPFLSSATDALGQPCSSPANVASIVLARVKKRTSLIRDGLRAWRKQHAAAAAQVTFRRELPARIAEWQNLRETEPWWMRFFIWLPPVRIARRARYSTVWPGESRPWCPERARIHWDQQKRIAETEIDEPSWRDWRAVSHAQEGKPCLSRTASLSELEGWLDTHLRFDVFWLTLHYWEARWLDGKLEESIVDPQKASIPSLVRYRWRRRAMIAPCIAATLYKLPSLFLAREPTDELVTDAVDLLIIDEAGQVLPNIAGASLAVARRAIVVGDTFQLSPIATLPRYVDWANWNGVGESMEGLTPENLETAGITASGGLLMRMAQHGCRHRQHARFPRGFWLREHRRCVAPIIEYCNELIYGGLLDPLRLEPSKGIYPWPHMGLVHVDGTSITNGSRTNPAEVATVVEWVENNWQAVFDWYRFKAKQHSPLFTPIDDDSIRESRKLIAVAPSVSHRSPLATIALPCF